MTPSPVVVAWSGGKDSSLALEALRKCVDFAPVALLTTVTREYDRVSMHGVRRTLVHAQAAALGLPLVEAVIPAKATNELYERAMECALDDIRTRLPSVRHIAFGDLFLEEVRAYRERQLAGTDFTPVFPVWGLDTRVLAERFIADGYHAIAVCVDSQQIDASFAGRRFSREFVRDLPATADPCGENGEFHTFVADGPIFAFPIEYQRGSVELRDERFAYCDLTSSQPSDRTQQA